MWQALFGAVINEPVAIETRETLGRAKPKKAMCVRYDAAYVVAWQAIGDGIAANWKSLAPNITGDSQPYGGQNTPNQDTNQSSR